MPGPCFLRGEGVDLHVVAEEDLQFVSRWRNDPDVRRWLPRSRPEAPLDIESFHDDDTGMPGDGVRLLACDDGERVGLVSLFLVEPDSSRARMGAWIEPGSQGQGYGRAAASLLVTYAFEERGLRKLVANARADNDASRAVLEGLGFIQEGRQREHYFVAGEYVDRVNYGLFADEWPAEN